MANETDNRVKQATGEQKENTDNQPGAGQSVPTQDPSQGEGSSSADTSTKQPPLEGARVDASESDARHEANEREQAGDDDEE